MSDSAVKKAEATAHMQAHPRSRRDPRGSDTQSQVTTLHMESIK